jgi:DNA polymerase-3 subunit delta'
MFFKDIIGQSEIKIRLIQSVIDSRVAHAQLFLGSEGSGNLALAFAFAQYITCENKQADDSCCKCASCVK